MGFLKERGNSTLESAIIFPLIFLIVFFLIGLAAFFYRQAVTIEASSYTLRRVGQNWYNGASLYYDVLGDFDFSEAVEEKKDQGFSLFQERTKPLLGQASHSKLNYTNLLIYKVLEQETNIEGDRRNFSYPILTGSKLLRNLDLTEEMFEDAFNFFENSESSESRNSEVFVVDDSDKETDYKQVYHLYEDCSYVERGEGGVKSTQGEMRDLGFRVCRQCLARKTGLYE